MKVLCVTTDKRVLVSDTEKERISIKMATCTKGNGNGTKNTGMVFIRIETGKCEFILRSLLFND